MTDLALSGCAILHIITRLDRGGSAGVVLDLARLQREHGARVGIVTGPSTDPQEDIELYAARSGVDVLLSPHLVREVAPGKDLPGFFELRRIIRRFRPDVVHTHTSKAGILGRFAACTAGVRPIVHTPHGHIFYGYFGPLATRAFIGAERAAARISSRIVTLTDSGRKDHLRKGIGRPEQYRVIPSGIDVRRFASADRNRIREENGWGDALIVGWAGRLAPVKDCAAFLRAAARVLPLHRNVRFLVAGDGEERAVLEDYARASGLEGRIGFLGDRRDMPEFMAALDMYVLSSRNEGFGRVLVEAMAAGVPVVSTDVGGAAEVLGGGEYGMLVSPGDPDMMADAMLRLINDGELRGQFRERGRVRAAEYDIRKTTEAYESLYLEILDR